MQTHRETAEQLYILSFGQIYRQIEKYQVKYCIGKDLEN